MQNNTENKSRGEVVKRTGQKEGFVQTLKEIWAYREMIASFVRRDLRGRYKGSVLGFLWTFINPLLQLLVYTIVFSAILNSTVEDYYLHLFVALIPWIFFSSSVLGGSVSILAQKDMVKKIYFPREVLPIFTVTSNFINMLLCFIVVMAVVLFSGRIPHPLGLLCLIPVFAVEYILALGMALFVSAITVYLRDMEHILGIIMMAWQYLTPVLYSIDAVTDKFIRFAFNLNPMTSIITAYRDILYRCQMPDSETLLGLLWAFVLGSVVLVIGWFTFTKLKRRFAEEL
jgi:ABC-2 type transport system permease protein